jgi:hypothetical protein
MINDIYSVYYINESPRYKHFSWNLLSDIRNIKKVGLEARKRLLWFLGVPMVLL